MRALVVIFAGLVMATTAAAQSPNAATPKGDPVRGRTLAMTWCSACHLVGTGDNRPVVADVPTFSSIASRLPTDTDVLAAFIANPHPPMPNLSLSRQDIRDVLAYIATLK